MAALARQARLARRGGAAASPRPGAYFLDAAEDEAGPRRYLSLLERAAAAAEVPVIASLNGVSPGGWANYAHAMQDAGAAAIELNIYYLPGDPHTSGRDVEQRHVDVTRLKDAVDLPVAVKLSPYFSSTGAMALRLDEAGADALVLFNRFLQPDIDPDKLAVLAEVSPSNPVDARLPRTIEGSKASSRSLRSFASWHGGPPDDLDLELPPGNMLDRAISTVPLRNGGKS
jgi:dihydroorotate dehydrogenase (fumarate)